MSDEALYTASDPTVSPGPHWVPWDRSVSREVMEALENPVAPPQGMWMKNPLYVRKHPRVIYLGQTHIDERGFLTFDSVINGLRAAAIIGGNYIDAGTGTTIHGMTDAFYGPIPLAVFDMASYITKRLGMGPNDPFPWHTHHHLYIQAAIQYLNPVPHLTGRDIDYYDARAVKHAIALSHVL